MKMTTTIVTVPKRMLTQLQTLARRRKTTVSHLMLEAYKKTYEHRRLVPAD